MIFRFPELIGLLVLPVGALAFMAFLIWLAFRAAARRRAALNSVRMAAMERGVPLPPEAFLDSRRPRPRNSLRAGIIGGGVGAGLAVALAISFPESRLWGWGLAVILVGVAHLIYWRIHGRKEWEEARARDLELARRWASDGDEAQKRGSGDPR
ncbi:MAG: hypothetical protein GXP48_05590 [Acidobacteria bacterium]|nr:hypothetical protein [Acidobacteriota bacterium]